MFQKLAEELMRPFKTLKSYLFLLSAFPYQYLHDKEPLEFIRLYELVKTPDGWTPFSGNRHMKLAYSSGLKASLALTKIRPLLLNEPKKIRPIIPRKIGLKLNYSCVAIEEHKRHPMLMSNDIKQLGWNGVYCEDFQEINGVYLMTQSNV